MFSSDRNIETIGQLIKLLKHNIELQGEYLKLDVMEKTVKVVTAILLFVILLLMAIAIFFFLSVAAAVKMGETIGYPLAFVIVSAFYLFVFFLFLVFRKSWIERPLIKFIANLLIK